jgi:hypothetical protein
MASIAAPSSLVTLTMSVAGVLTLLGNLAAISWFGMWMGLNSRTTNLATLKTILFVQIIPWFGLSFASALVIPLVVFPSLMRGGGTTSMQTLVVWMPLLIAVVSTSLSLAKDAVFLLWARKRLLTGFRDRAVQSIVPVRLQSVLIPPRADAPPPLAPT